MVETLTEKNGKARTAIEERTGFSSEIQVLMTIPYVSYFPALLIYAKLEEVDRFDTHWEVVGYMRLNPTIRKSSDSWINGGVSKHESGRVRWSKFRVRTQRCTTVKASL